MEGRPVALKVPNAAELKLLDQLRVSLNATPATLRLFKNNYTPVDGTVVGDLTEADFSGYAAINVTDLGSPSTVSGRAVTVSAAAKVFTHSGGATGNSIYGYYVTDAGGALLWAERDPAAPAAMSVGGSTYSVTPRLTLATEF